MQNNHQENFLRVAFPVSTFSVTDQHRAKTLVLKRQGFSQKQMIQNTKTGGVKIAWVKDPSVCNEALDTYVYARAAAHIMGLDNPSKNWRPFENKLKVEEVNPKQNPTKKSAESTAEILKRYQKNQSLV